MRYLSLFSGIEACTVAWEPLGWEPVAFAEVEPFPCAVLKHHWPDVPNLGDVAKITEERIRELGRIDLVVGGSPCQDLSTAGARAGLRNEDGSLTRSGLFDYQMEIFEYARKNNGARWMLWENVPGAFSSNKGYDFAYILGAMVQGQVPVPADGWRTGGGCVSRDGSRIVEWRVLDARFFGVAQRRRRVFALLHAGDWFRRPPVLFEQGRLSGDTQAGREKGEGASEGAADCFVQSGFGAFCGSQVAGALACGNHNPSKGDSSLVVVKDASREGCDTLAFAEHAITSPKNGNSPRWKAPCHALATDSRNDVVIRKAVSLQTGHTKGNGDGINQDDVAYTLSTSNDQAVCYELAAKGFVNVSKDIASTLMASDSKFMHAVVYENHPQDCRMKECKGGLAPSLSARMGTGGNNIPLVLASGQSNAEVSEDVSPALTCLREAPIVLMGQGGDSMNIKHDIAGTLRAQEHGHQPVVLSFLERAGKPGGGKGILVGKAKSSTLSTAQRANICHQEGLEQVVRRLTPKECERLQGFPDGHTDIPWRGKPHSPDSARYKALGNSMAVPVMRWIARRIDWSLAHPITEDISDPVYYEPDLFGGIT